MIWVIAIAFVFVIYLLRYVLNHLMNKGFDAIGNSRRQSKNMRGPEIVRLADMYPYEAARHQHNGTAYAINPMLLTPEYGPYQQANPYAQANPYTQANPYAAAPYQQANPYAQPNPYMQAAPGMPMGGTAPVMATIENGKTKSELQAEKDFIVKKGGWICYNCQKANYSYVGSCSCGMSRDESEKKYADKKIAVAELEEKMAKVKEEEKAMALNEKVWECLTCHHLNKDSAKICKSCGQIKAMGFKTISPNNCPGCGSEIEPTDKFCNVCGYKLKTEE